jgi:hypothetical protein
MRNRLIMLAGVLAFFAVDSAMAQVTDAPKPAAPQPGKDMSQIRMVPQEKFALAPFEIAGGVMIFRVQIAGRDAWMMLDNGSGRSAIDTGFAATAGMKVEDTNYFVTTLANEKIPMRRVADVAITVPGLVQLQGPMPAIDLSGLTATTGRKIDGILGADYLGQLALAIDFDMKRFALVPSGVFKPLPALQEFPLTSGAKPQVEVTVNGQKLSLTVDLGMDATLALTPEAWKRVAPPDTPVVDREALAIDGTVRPQSGVLPGAAIGAFAVDKPEVLIMPFRPDFGDGQVGLGFFRHFPTIIDLKTHRLWLKPLPQLKPPG